MYSSSRKLSLNPPQVEASPRAEEIANDIRVISNPILIDNNEENISAKTSPIMLDPQKYEVASVIDTMNEDLTKITPKYGSGAIGRFALKPLPANI